jgi:hypothetical protein
VIKTGARAVPFSVLVASPAGIFVLAQDGGFASAFEKEPALVDRLSGGAPFTVAGTQVFVTRSTLYCGGKTLYECVALHVA